jgi:hypothetical protein
VPKHELFEELEAFNPRWQQRFPTIRDASKAAGVLPLFEEWLESTPDGLRYAVQMKCVPDYSVKRSDAGSLPYSLDNIGEVPDESEPDSAAETESEAGSLRPFDWSEPED